MKKRIFILCLTFILLSTNIVVYSDSILSSNDNIKAIDQELFNEEDQLSIINDLCDYINLNSEKLLTNSYYLYIKNKIDILKEEHQKYIYNNISLKNDLLNNDLSLNEFHELDSYYLSKNKDKEKLKEEVELFYDLINISREYYILSNKGVRIYPSFVSNFINNLQTGIKNREKIINSEYIEYEADKFYSKNKVDKGYIINRELNNITLLINFFVNLEIYNYINIHESLLNDLEVYIVPFSLRGVHGFAYQGNKTSKSNMESIYISHVFPGVFINDWLLSLVKNTTLHELGHIIDGRSRAKGLNYDVYDEYRELNFEISDKYKEKKYQDYFYISGDDITKKHPEASWNTRLFENFAEDFRVFMSNQLPDHLSYENTPKRTIFKYNDKIEDIFLNIIQK